MAERYSDDILAIGISRVKPHSPGSLPKTASHCILIAYRRFNWDGLTIFLCAMAVTSHSKSHLQVPQELCPHSLGRHDRRSTEILNRRYAFMPRMTWQHLPSSLLSITHPILMRHFIWGLLGDSLCQRPATQRHSAAETLLLPGVVIRVDNSIIVKCSDKFPCGGLEQSRSLCGKLCRVSEGFSCHLTFTIQFIYGQHTVAYFADIKGAMLNRIEYQKLELNTKKGVLYFNVIFSLCDIRVWVQI